MFRGTVNHTRFLPLKHSFKYKVTYFWFDIKIKKSIFFKKMVYHYFLSLKRIMDQKKRKELFRLISNQLYSISIKNIKYIKILCLPRILGYVFNQSQYLFIYDSKKFLKRLFLRYVILLMTDTHMSAQYKKKIMYLK